ncbi:hypothetical protein [Mesorhizobium sp.]|uniref:hypothetical protein n=1 Tax=Mesorhizobium sp. TaxID=1871066 RepID=UPI0012065940|nr:hypothetical protein [Mesorhizobium sp.]TIL34264.1 MAG: hypothetical protein E5Y85_11015 [Mesorhizobium sp.]
MERFRKGDVVTIEGVIDSDYVHDGKIKIRVEPYHDFYGNVSGLKMVRPVIDVGDNVTYPAEGYKTGKVLAIIDGYCWVKLENGYGGGHVSWPISSINRVDPEPAVAIPALPVSDEFDRPPTGAAPDLADAAHADPGPKLVGEDEVVF